MPGAVDVGTSHTSYGLQAQDLRGELHASPLQRGAAGNGQDPVASMAMMLLLLAGAGDAGEADAEKLVTAVSKPDHCVRFTHHSMGKGFSLP